MEQLYAAACLRLAKLYELSLDNSFSDLEQAQLEGMINGMKQVIAGFEEALKRHCDYCSSLQSQCTCDALANEVRHVV